MTSSFLDDLQRHDRERYLCALFAPEPARGRLLTLYAFNFELARIRELVSEPMPGLIRLQWWREMAEAAFSRKNVAASHPHPLAAPFAALCREPGLSLPLLLQLIDARERDFDVDPPPDMTALEHYVRGTSSNLCLLALQALDAADSALEEAAHHIGMAWGLLGMLRAAHLQMPQGRCYFPAGMMEERGLSLDRYGGKEFAEHLKPLALILAARAEDHLAAARAKIAAIPAEQRRAALPVLLPSALSASYLARIRRSGGDILTVPPALPPFLVPLKLWHAAASLSRTRHSF